ncbi:MAG: hypothetical protein AB7I48_18680, partial [Planctomycetaceae bacterium]
MFTHPITGRAAGFVQMGAAGYAADETSRSPGGLAVFPEQVTLIGPRSEQRIIVTGLFADGSV